MKPIYFFLQFVALIFALLGCSQNDSVFSRKIENNPGSLKVQNPIGFLWTTGVDTVLDIELIIVAAGGLKLNNISATLQTSDPFIFKGGVYPGTGGTCANELDSGDACTIIVEYSPTDLESHSAILKLDYSDVLGSKSSTYAINADSRPILSFEYGTTYNFGNKFIGSSTDLKIRVSNIGRVAAENITINNMSAPFSFKGGSYPGTGGSCGTRLVPGQTCDIYVNYSPTTNGQHLQDIVLNYLNATKPESNTLSLTAWGFREATLTISSVSDDFGQVASGVTHQKIYTVTHSSGDVSANLLTISGLNSPFSKVGGTCGSVLSIDQKTCTIIIGLNSATGGTWSSPMNFSYYNGLQTITIAKAVTGQTLARPVLTITPTTFNFGTVAVGSSRTELFTVQYVSGDLPATAITLNHSNGAFIRNGGTCGTSLSSDSCTIGVRFIPSGSAIWTSASVFSYNDSVSTNTSNLSLIGNGPASLTSLATNFGTVLPTNSKTLDISITNTNSTTATNISAGALPSKFTFANGSYPGNTYANACGTSLAANTSCRLTITFDPQASGTFSGSLRINYNNGNADTFYNISLSGVGTDVANLMVADKDFGTASVNSYTTISPLISVVNSSDMQATSITVISMPEGFAFRGGIFPGTSGTCSTSLNKGSCTLDIYFAPTVAKIYSGTLSIRYNNGSSIVTTNATLSGEAVNTSDLFINNFHVVNFGSVNNAEPVKQITVKVSHGGSSNPATITSKSPLSGEFYIVSDSCPSSLVNGENCNVTLGFKPTTSGAKTSSFQVSYQAEAVSKTTTRSLIGNGLLVSTINSTATNFGNVNYGTPKNLTVTLTKSGDLTITSLTAAITGTGFSFLGGTYPGTGGTCSSNLISSCNLVLTYSATGSGLQTGNLRLSFNNGYQTATPIDLTLTATAVSVSNLSFLAASYDFGKVIQTQKSEKTITLRNTGNIPGNFTAPTLTAPYYFKGGTYPGTGGTCTTSLNSNQSCTMLVEFSPTSTGIKTQNLTIDYNNGSTSTSASTAFTGEGLAQAIISISDGNPYNFGSTNVNGTISKIFTLTNSGSVNGTALNGVFTSVFNFLGGSFPGTGGTCTTTLVAGQSCTIVLSFTPVAAQAYSGTFILNYNDGLNAQTELKNLTGTGSNSLNYNLYLAQIGPKESVSYQLGLMPSMKIADINQDGLNEWLEPVSNEENSKYFYYFVDGQDPNTVLVRIYNLFPTGIVEGFSVIPLKQDLNSDGYNDLLIGIYQKSFMNYYLRGYDILSGKDGNVLERYLPISYQ